MALLIHQLYDISVHYFSYESIITIDTNDYQTDGNYPFVSIVINKSYIFLDNDCNFYKSTECHFNTTIGHLIDKHKNDKTIFNNYNFYLDTMVNFNNITSVDSYQMVPNLYSFLLRTLYLNESILTQYWQWNWPTIYSLIYSYIISHTPK